MNTAKPCILIVDDDVEDHIIISDAILHLDPSRILYFKKNGIEALEFLEELHTDAMIISLLVLDLNMPKMGGVELLQRIKADARFNTIPVVIYSTSINTKDKENCIQLGAHSYITKPLSFKESIQISETFLKLAENNL